MKNRFLMCPPDYFGVEYNINPWMTNNLGRVDHTRATNQWRNLFDTLSKHAEIELLEPQPRLPDMVFTANAGLVKENTFIPSRFQYPERQPEETHFRAWFSSKGYDLSDIADHANLSEPVSFEGEGDALLQPKSPHNPNSNLLWMGYGFRTNPHTRDLIKTIFPQCIALQLVDPRFYHLDTCFCLLPGGRVMYYPPAFSQESCQTIENNFAIEDRLEIDEENALYFACNAVVIENNLILNNASPALTNRLASLGYQTILTPVDEFLKAGGGTKCLVLCL